MHKTIFLLITLSFITNVYANTWTERVRTYALKMIDEANTQVPQKHELISELRNAVEKSPITDQASSRLYGMVIGNGPTIHLSYILEFIEFPIAASVLIHEASHILGYGEQGAEDIAYLISKNSMSSRGIIHVGYPKLHTLKQFCGKPVIKEIPKSPFPDTPMSKKELNEWVKFYYVDNSNIEYHSYTGLRIKNWVGGSEGCEAEFSKDLNRGGLTNENFWFGPYEQPIADYLNKKRKPTFDLIQKRFDEFKKR